MRTRVSQSLSLLVAVAVAFVISAGVAKAQFLADLGDLQLDRPEQCAALQARIGNRSSGGQWLIGDRIPLYGRSNALQPFNELNGSFLKVACYRDLRQNDQTQRSDDDLVFVASQDFRTCGWVQQADLVPENRSQEGLATEVADSVCQAPRAMFLEKFCDQLARITGDANATTECLGVPLGLRTKAVLTGSTDDGLKYPFRLTPRGPDREGAEPFFSVFEIHDLAPGARNGEAMALVGDGVGDMFGWIDVRALKLWPTRMGLFYDLDGLGKMFTRRRDLIANWRDGRPEPDITSGKSPTELTDFVLGSDPLLSYPVVRTVNEGDPVLVGGDTPFQEVIFLGQTGDGAAAQLLAQAQLAKQVEAVGMINVMLVVDTTESMVPYLPLIRDGIAQFVRNYERRSLDSANRLPQMRLSVVAYSDFTETRRTSLGDPIKTKELMAPSSIGGGFNIDGPLRQVAAHTGLTDDVGGFDEAALETVATLAGWFDDPGWFEDGPRIIIHIADHGSRQTVSVGAVLAKTAAANAFYLPIAVTTDDEGNPKRSAARRRFVQQATAMLAPLVDDAKAEDVATIDLDNREVATPQVVEDGLFVVVAEVFQRLNELRSEVIGEELITENLDILNRASSRIRLSESVGGDISIEDKVIVKAQSGFAPLRIKDGGITKDIAWNYTVALEPAQALFLQTNFNDLCNRFDSADRGRVFRESVIRLARIFSGDIPETSPEVVAIFQDLRNVPGASQSFLAQDPRRLLERIDRGTPEVLDELRKDICWTSFHLDNMAQQTFVRPEDAVWQDGAGAFALRDGAELPARRYLFKPLVGAETVYVPSWFFVLPSQVIQSEAGAPCFFGDC